MQWHAANYLHSTLIDYTAATATKNLIQQRWVIFSSHGYIYNSGGSLVDEDALHSGHATRPLILLPRYRRWKSISVPFKGLCHFESCSRQIAR